MQVFLSYRRRDVGGYAGRLADALLQRLGANSVFQDVVAIAPGQDFTAAIDRALDDCDAFLAVIGPGWLTASTPQGTPRLFDAEDYVRLELARALNRNVRVVPVLVGGAALPAASDLPDELRGLVRRQAVVLHDETWHQDVDGLVGSLRGEPAVPTTRRPRWLVTGAAVAVALVVLGAAAWLWGPRTNTGSGGGGQRPSASGGQAGSGTGMASCAPAEGSGWTAIVLNDNPVGKGTDPAGPLFFTVTDARWRPRGDMWQVTLATSMKNSTSVDVRHAVDVNYGPLVVGGQEFKATCFRTPTEVVDPGQSSDALIGFTIPCEPRGYMELVVQGGRVSVTKAAEPGAC